MPDNDGRKKSYHLFKDELSTGERHVAEPNVCKADNAGAYRPRYEARAWFKKRVRVPLLCKGHDATNDEQA